MPAVIDSTGGQLKIEVIIGFGLPGGYQLTITGRDGTELWERDGTNINGPIPRLGVNVPRADLDGATLTWTVRVGALQGGIDQDYHVEVNIIQDGQVVAGSPDAQDGTFQVIFDVKGSVELSVQ